MSRKYLTEILDEANKDVTILEKYRGNAALKFLFMHAFTEEHKFVLPEGDPPYKHDAAPIGMSPANLMQETRKFYVFTKARELSSLRREALFIQLLENIHPTEATLMLAIKDQKLDVIYTNITADVAADYGFIARQVKQDGEPTSKKS